MNLTADSRSNSLARIGTAAPWIYFHFEKRPRSRAENTSDAKVTSRSEGVAKYFSTNGEQHSAFYAEAPAGSRQAARLERIYAIVDPDAPQRTVQQGHLQGVD